MLFGGRFRIAFCKKFAHVFLTTEFAMRFAFALVSLMFVAGVSQAQFNNYVPQQQTCANGQCGVVRSAVMSVGNTIQNVGSAVTRIATPSCQSCGVMPQVQQVQYAQPVYSQPCQSYSVGEPVFLTNFQPFHGRFRIFRR